MIKKYITHQVNFGLFGFGKKKKSAPAPSMYKSQINVTLNLEGTPQSYSLEISPSLTNADTLKERGGAQNMLNEAKNILTRNQNMFAKKIKEAAFGEYKNALRYLKGVLKYPNPSLDDLISINDISVDYSFNEYCFYFEVNWNFLFDSYYDMDDMTDSEFKATYGVTPNQVNFDPYDASNIISISESGNVNSQIFD